ncbi:RlmE family RNA methyltransferase [Consotaella salsifontis]|uniref:Ribosomal RNA large subunit methyltransferase E n=1 Tax=Consotaella salsifontis TaxID=1365950 RepID=A0A1T4SV79_9HYPH|nr:RlmE family RNA methyltransferase [Consotaella salsifontis]SKA31791.1 23S rRNA Um-2552 2'-O-methyltransferase [Consotaella salsifontis]
MNDRHGGERGLTVKVKSKQKASSRRWLERQLNDPYVRRAKAEGYRSRAAYKLIEIDDRYKLLKKGMRVVDLGAAPGGWCQVVVDRTGAGADAVRLVGIDVLPIEPLAGATFLEMDFLDDAAPGRLIEELGGAPDVVLSDMAAPTTGHRRTDHLRTMHLCEIAADFALRTLRPGGHFLAKTFQGGTENELLSSLKQAFSSVHHVKPPASRDGSVELYLLARGFKRRASPETEDGAENEAAE